jgi:alkylhydroperoxidase/carboxymuconolactone decarboxylase family protein YurZ
MADQTNRPDRSNDPSFQRGWEIRKKIGGKVGRTANVDDDLYDIIIRYAFGDVWSRPGLDIDTRRLLTLAMTIAGGHYEEFKLHLRFALANGMSRDTVKEVMLQSAVYCGIPASLGAFRHAEEIYREFDEQTS